MNGKTSISARIASGLLGIVSLAVLLGGGGPALVSGAFAAGTVHKLIDNGPSANRVDIVVLGDGYRSTEMAKFAADALKLATEFLKEPPIARYKNYFNVWRIDTPSANSGASHSGPPPPGQTYYGAYYDCFSIQRLVCIDEARVTEELNAAMAPDQREIVLVVVNDAEYGGSGGQYAVTSVHPLAPQIAIHELGHSFGRLDDEYVEPFNCGRYTTPVGGFNVTQSVTRATIPWAKWIGATTPVPTLGAGTAIGAYEGAFYCADDWYRPTFDSKMNTLGMPFYYVNGEQLIRSIYQIVSLVDWVAPAQGTVRIAEGTSRTFRARKIAPAATSLVTTWRLNGVVVSTTNWVTISSTQLAGRNKVLLLTIRDKTALVRNDPDRHLIEAYRWTLSP